MPVRVVGALAIGAGAALALAACTSRGGKESGPHAEFTNELVQVLKPGGSAPLSLATDAVREVRNGGALVGSYDGTRLLKAADEHAFGTPTPASPKDVRGDGSATFNELRAVVAAYDSNADGTLDVRESAAFRAEHGISWVTA